MTGRLSATLQGHTRSLTSVAFSADGLTLASGSDDQTVRLWDVRTGQTMATLRGHTGFVNAVAFGPDGQTLASGSMDDTVRLWDVKAGPHKATLQGHTDRVESVAFSPDGLTLASISRGFTGLKELPREARLWDVKTGEHRATLEGMEGVTFVEFSPDSLTLASVSKDPTVRLWDVKTGQARATLKGHTNTIQSVAFSLDSLTLASGSFDGTVRLWDVKTGQHKATLPGHTGFVLSVAYSPDGLTLATASGAWDEGRREYVSSEVRLWDVRTEQPRATFQGHEGGVWSLEFSRDGERVFGWDRGGSNVRAWTVKDGQPTDPATAPPRSSNTDVTSPDGSLRAEARGNVVVLLDLVNYDPRRDLDERRALDAVNRPYWHQQQAAQAEKDQEWFAAAFHLGRLLKDRPFDLDLHLRRLDALGKHGHAADSQAPLRMDKLP
jgi:hypothetical protein